VLEKDDKIWDQNAFNDLFRRGGRQGLPLFTSPLNLSRFVPGTTPRIPRKVLTLR